MPFAGLLLALVACAPPGRPVIAEVYYDAAGDDTGREFVELYNPAGEGRPLAGLRLEAGDGSGPGRWSLRWTGTGSDSVPARGRFVIGGARVVPAPQATVALDLQNGPDAVRLVWPDGATEVVGYGAHEFAEYACGAPAPDVPSGQSLARVPDDSDRGANAVDFRAAVPSPGRANLPGRDGAVAAGSLAIEPAQPEPGAAARFALTVENRGAARLAAGEVTLRASSSLAATAIAESVLALPLDSADSARVVLELPGLPAGKQRLAVRVVVAGDEVPDDDADSLLARAGPGPLVLVEIQFHPANGEGEWVEVWNRSGAALEPAGFTLSDRSASAGHIEGTPAALAPESLAVIAQDRAALLVRFPALDRGRVWGLSPWASLNDRDDSAGVADVVILREPDGTPSDRVAYSSAGLPRGIPLERGGDGRWDPGSTPGGTPLERARPLEAGPLLLAARPRRVRAGAGVELRWRLPWARGEVAIELYDLSGRRVAVPVPDLDAGASGTRVWAVAGVPPGLYVLAMRATAPEGGVLNASVALRIEGPAP